MATITVKGATIPLDGHGCLHLPEQWNESVRDMLAKRDGITLDERLIWAINSLRSYYQEYKHPPFTRNFEKKFRERFGNCPEHYDYLAKRLPPQEKGNITPMMRLWRLAGFNCFFGCYAFC